MKTNYYQFYSIVRKAIFALGLCVLSIFCQAQQWYVEEQPADELKGTKRLYNLTCKLSWDEYFKCVEGEWDSFTIQTRYSIDYELEDSDPLGIGFWFGVYDTYTRYCIAKIGLYDEHSRLIKVFQSVKLLVSDKESDMAFLKSSDIAKEVLQHLFKTKGYVRIIIPRAASEDDIDLRIPHFSYPERR